LLRSIFALIVLCALLLPVAAQDPKPKQEPPAKETPPKEAKITPSKDNKSNGELKYTAEQIVESVILMYGTRPGLDHIRRNGIERGKITRYTPDGNAEEANYERRFIRGENLDKDKIRLDQKLSNVEYSLIFGEGKMFGVINGAAFTPKQDAMASFISQHHHSIDSLLRYKECGSTLTVVGKDQQKGLDLFVVDLTDKEQRKTRYYISARSLRILWLEYEEGFPGGTAVKYTKKFLDYRPVQQTLVPYRTLLYEDGREAQEVRVQTITFGIKVSDSIFKAPEA